MTPQRKAWLIGSDIVMLILGVVCIAFCQTALQPVIVCAGITCLLAAIGDLVGIDSFKGFELFSGWTFFDGLFFLLLALACFCSGFIPESIFAKVAATLTLLCGVVELLSASHLRRTGAYSNTQWGFFLAAVLLIIFGVVLFKFPQFFLLFMGISMVFRALVAMLVNRLGNRRKASSSAAH